MQLILYGAAAFALIYGFADEAVVKSGPFKGALKRHDGTFVFPDAPTVVFCSFVKAGNIYLDAATGNVISEAEATSRAAREGCVKP